MADIAVGGNRTTLTTIAGDVNTALNTLDPNRRPSGGTGKTKRGTFSDTGDAAKTFITITHGAGFTPTRADIQPTSAAAAAAHWVSNFTATTFRLNWAAAPANAAPLTGSYTVSK